MSYEANQYNYATPLSSSKRLVGKTFTGAQMLDFDAWLESVSAAGVTRGTYVADTFAKTISITADQADAYTPYLDYNAYNMLAKPNTKYTLSYRRSGAAGLAYLFENGLTDNMVVSSQTATYGVITLTTSDDATFITFRVGASAAGTTATYSELMINEGDTAATYEEYNSGIAYPNTTKLFTLHDNVLDGSYYPVTGDVGLWGNELSDASGNLSTPFVVSNTELLTVNSFRLISAADNYPVAFTVKFYSGDTLLYTITETNNTKAEYVHHLPSTIGVSGIVVSVTKISKANAAARLYNLYNLPYVKRVDTAKVRTTETSEVSLQLFLARADMLPVNQTHSAVPMILANSADTLKSRVTESVINIENAIAAADTAKALVDESTAILNTIDKTTDTFRVKHLNVSHILNTIDVTTDLLKPKVVEDTSHVTNIIDVTTDILRTKNIDKSVLTNVHSRMKDPSRRIYGKVYITYTDPMLESETTIEASSTAYNSEASQIKDANIATNGKFFTLYENDLSGKYVLSDQYSQVGWVSGEISNADGTFGSPAPYLKYSFAARPITGLSVTFDDSRGAIPVDFTVTYTSEEGTSTVKTFVGNTEPTISISDTVADVVSVTVTITKLSKGGYPVAILEIPVVSTMLYVGYQDHSELMSIDLLEELTYDDDVEALGGVSANEVTVTLDNSNQAFYFNNPNSIVAKQLKRNRKVVPWLGVEVVPGEIEWYTLGTFWSYTWDVPVGALTAKVIAFDTLGLLDTTSFVVHQMQINKSVYALVEYILADAKLLFDFLEYEIDDSLKDIIIPYAWFSADSHTAALRKLAQCYPIHIYCDRDGRICARPQKLHLDYYYDSWADNTNVINKSYSSLYTTLPNIINVNVNRPVIVANDQLATDELRFDVSLVPTRTLNFNRPYVDNIQVTVDCDATVQHTYEVYSCGITFTFTGSGYVNAIECIGSGLDISSTSVITHKDADSIRLNGAVTRNISADFIQNSAHALLLIDRLESLSANDKYDAEVNYRGDIALTINDPILLVGGIAPDNRYNIKRHQLFWDGALSGVANLNT